MSSLLPAAVSEALGRGASVLAPNQRIARTLRKAYDADQRTAGNRTWTPPEILALDTWLTTRWTALILAGHETRTLLNRTQEHSHWRAVLSADLLSYPDLNPLASTDSLADLAARAWRLLHLYEGAPRLAELAQTTDTRAFLRWSRDLSRRLQRAGQITAAQLPAELNTAHAEGLLEISPAGLLLVDFSPLPPASDTLLSAIEQAGYSVVRTQTKAPEAVPATLHAAADCHAEVLDAAHWIGAQLTRNPHARIAVVVADQQTRRAEIDRVFHQVLAPSQAHITAARLPLPYEFSLGDPLATLPQITAAFNLLRWPAEPLPLPSISALLLSPFVGGAAGPLAPESLAAADFDAHILRQHPLLRPELSLHSTLRLLSRHHALPQLQQRLRALERAAAEEQLIPATPGSEGPRQGHAEWSDAFRKVLHATGWTRAVTSAGSVSFQAHRRWDGVLDELATLDFEPVQVTSSQALATLTRLARETVFAPEAQDTQVQVLGPLELGGLPFDALWFLGADDLSWPVTALTHPLLPFPLQRACNMPGANSEAEAAAAQALTRRVEQAASEVVFSFAAHAEEGERRPSPLVSHLPAHLPTSSPEPSPMLELQHLEDTAPLPSITGLVHGGARVLELQAACGFRAFAELRLHSADLETHGFGLNPRDRGTVVHRTLEEFWRTLESQPRLRSLTPDARRELLAQAIEAGIRKAAALAESPWDTRYLAVQRTRLHALLTPWLELETSRPEFQVTSQERLVKAHPVGPIQLDLRVDRIDETADGLLILDYKTGSSNPADWLSERPEAPQLPLYATVLDKVAGVAFVQLQPGKNLCMKGFADSPAVLEKSARMEAVSFPEQVDRWREILTELAWAFSAGDARVLPKSYPHTCKHCSQRMLCRLDPTTLIDSDDEDYTAQEVMHG